MELKKVQQATLTKTIFATLAVSSLIGIALVFPSIGYLYSQFEKDKNRNLYIKKIFKKLQKQKLLSISEDSEGKVTITISDEGKKKALSYKVETLKLEKPTKWDKTWRIVIFDIPESQRKARDIFRSHLGRLGFYSLQKSVFVTPYPCKEEIDFLKHNFEIAKNITFLEARYIDNQNLLKNHFQVQ